jgi:hypothetical protein
MATQGGTVRMIGGIAALIAVVGFGAWFARAATTEPDARFCTMGLPLFEIDGRTVVPQDMDPPGRDACDGEQTERGRLILGLDCKVRRPDGEVIATLEPNRDDGDCGLPDPGDDGFPSSWSLD